ncbi:MAG: hypothetical protein PHG58_01460 [Clostridia bacterium]|nr:hypothetical protein [Clostridia bacterium]
MFITKNDCNKHISKGNEAFKIMNYLKEDKPLIAGVIGALSTIPAEKAIIVFWNWQVYKLST